MTGLINILIEQVIFKVCLIITMNLEQNNRVKNKKP
jgi:hypothetical protein